MILYTMNDCKACISVKELANKHNIEVIEVKLKDDKFVNRTEEGLKEVPIIGVPSLNIKDDIFIFGEFDCCQYITKGFLHETRLCPYLNKECLEKKCEKFVIMFNNKVEEGGCSDSMVAKLLVSVLSRRG